MRNRLENRAKIGEKNREKKIVVVNELKSISREGEKLREQH